MPKFPEVKPCQYVVNMRHLSLHTGIDLAIKHCLMWFENRIILVFGAYMQDL